MLSEQNLKRIDELKRFYQTSRALVIPALWMVQEEQGYVSQDAMKYVAKLLDVPFGHILGVVTFYTMLHQNRIGRHHIEVCTNVSCLLRGSDKIVTHLEKRLGIKMGETSKDGKWTLSEVECMGSCGTAPMFAVGDEYYENLTPEKIDKLLADLERK
jgi:NADH-quinone oxidoreductase subunit E